jgi:hypothetical protein
VPEQSIATDHAGEYDESLEDDIKKKRLSKVSKNKSLPYEVDEDFTMYRSGRDGRKKLKLVDSDDFIEEEPEMDEPKKRLSEADSHSDVKNETTGLITRQRALQGRGGNGETLIEFPDGLPTASSRSIISSLYMYSLRVDNTCRFGQEHGLQKVTLTTIFYYNIYRNINKYIILLKYFLRLIYTYDFHIFKINILEIICSQRF